MQLQTKKGSIMDFLSMGHLDAETEIEKGSIHSADVKNATIRVSNDYLDLLNVVAGQLGLSRQSFMSKLVENYASQAVADYYMGYAGTFAGTNLDAFFENATNDEDMKGRLQHFLKDVNYKVTWARAANRGIYLMPIEEETKLRLQHLERAKISELHGQDVTWSVDLPPLPQDEE